MRILLAVGVALYTLAGCHFNVKRTEVVDAGGVLKIDGAKSLSSFEALTGCDILAAPAHVEQAFGGEAALLSLEDAGTFAFGSIITPFIDASGVEHPDHLQQRPVTQVAGKGDEMCKQAGRRFTIKTPDSVYEFVALPVRP